MGHQNLTGCPTHLIEKQIKGSGVVYLPGLCAPSWVSLSDPVSTFFLSPYFSVSVFLYFQHVTALACPSLYVIIYPWNLNEHPGQMLCCFFFSVPCLHSWLGLKPSPLLSWFSPGPPAVVWRTYTPAIGLTHSFLSLRVGRGVVALCIFATQGESMSIFLCSRALDTQMVWMPWISMFCSEIYLRQTIVITPKTMPRMNNWTRCPSSSCLTCAIL